MMAYGEFELAGHRFVAFGPESDADPREWQIVVSKDGEEVLREKVPMLYAPRFGVDVEDAAARDAAVERIIKKLELE